MRVLGIDPGTGILGFGVVEVDAKRHMRMVTAGVITTPPHTSLEVRLADIFDGLTEIITETRPQQVAIEKLFFAQNITTAISVSHARGVAMLAAQKQLLPIFEYTPLQIKQSLTGYGRAEKKQVQELVRVQLHLAKPPRPDDAADALAAAITHILMHKAAPAAA
ncbi:MAG: crossover junction endodeoxyribonuclease RuvC [Candidatus Nomurabacteria bacterium]|jgi:crossover junction endodeoxyribonuclease RuvC|nr:crossover junction endodeoxyribonuclease RuvC [Candidatus Nomurabacteria bacterium]